MLGAFCNEATTMGHDGMAVLKKADIHLLRIIAHSGLQPAVSWAANERQPLASFVKVRASCLGASVVTGDGHRNRDGPVVVLGKLRKPLRGENPAQLDALRGLGGEDDPAA
ncbi:MAG: hypothetical protein AAFX09_07800 [Pseudomonadota bacterium]